MYRSELVYFTILALIVIFSQFLPTNLLLVLDNLFLRIIIILILLYLISIGPTAGIFGLVAIGVLYLERNRRKVVAAAKKIDLMDTNFQKQATVEEASTPQKTVPVKEFDKPDENDTEFFPSETCNSGNFEPVAPTINEKTVLSTIYPLRKSGAESGSGSTELFEKLGFGHINDVETIGDN
jgi:hypothetical protein